MEFARRMEDPESYARVVSLMMDPATAKNYLEWSDPAIYAKWLQALVDPNFYTAVMRPVIDPTTYLRWMALPVDQRAWSVGLNTMNPMVWMKWMTAGLNPKIISPFFKAADPSTSARWLQAAADPANIRVWAGFAPIQNGTSNGNAPNASSGTALLSQPATGANTKP
jgi:hypothetical protein